MFWFRFYNWKVCISRIGRSPYLGLHQRHVLVKTIPSCVSLFVLYPILRKSHSGAKSAFDDPRSKALERFLNPCNRPLPREYELLYCMYCAALEIFFVVAFCLWYDLIEKAENHTNVFFNPSMRFHNPCNRQPPREYELLYCTAPKINLFLWSLSFYDMILSTRQKFKQISF